MTKIRLFFDECVGRTIIDDIQPYLNHHTSLEFELAHIFDRYNSGDWDEKWLPELEKDWLVITADRGKRGGVKKGQKLPSVCKSLGITYIMLGPSVARLSSFDKMNAVAGCIGQLPEVQADPPGSPWLLTLGPTGHPILRRKPEKSVPKKRRKKDNPPSADADDGPGITI
jgi:hypothetical protein